MPKAAHGPMSLHATIVAALTAHPAVQAARPVGSRAGGRPTALSDWDVEVETDLPAALRAALPDLLAHLRPLAAGWDPNGERPTYMLLLDGPFKVDVILASQRQPAAGRPHRVSAATLPRIDHHFWDWTLWLAGKQLRGLDDLVADQLLRMHEQLLRPLGVRQAPTSIGEAIAVYRAAYRAAAARLGLRADKRLDDAVSPTVLQHLAGTG